jgi:hypothetical protein
VRQLAERRAIEERNRRQVAYAVCQLLLGETEEAADTLGLLPGSDTKCERTMLAFVKVRCPWVCRCGCPVQVGGGLVGSCCCC